MTKRKPKKEHSMPLKRVPRDLGPTIAAYLTEERFPGAARQYDRIIRWWCNDPTMPQHSVLPDGPEGWEAAYREIVLEGKGLSPYDFLIWQARQNGGDVANFSDGQFPVPTGDDPQTVQDSLYLTALSGRYSNTLPGHSIWHDMVRGSNQDVANFINLGGERHAGELATFDPGTYTGQFKAAVEAKLA